MASKKIKPPKGTRDLYPEDLLRQRYITNAWRDASIRCGFEEIAGPTFESTELYSVKSGDAILNELFQTFSGKGGSETLDKLVEKGKADFALRPEFTPTLARMYAAHAKQLPKPCKWFTAGPYFRAERPQRGRLREFLQWNVDVIGLPSEEATPESKALMDCEIMQCMTLLFENVGISQSDTTLNINHRKFSEGSLCLYGVNEHSLSDWFNLLDKVNKLSFNQYMAIAAELGEEAPTARRIQRALKRNATTLESIASGRSAANDWIDRRMKKWNAIGDAAMEELESKEVLSKTERQHTRRVLVTATEKLATFVERLEKSNQLTNEFNRSFESLVDLSIFFNTAGWLEFDESIVRGLAYYTGTVFEALADGERAVAGGGRYDNLIELFGGPPTPACGFGMGDVVLGNLLDDKALMPEGLELMEAVARPQASIRPQAFIVPNRECDNSEANEPLVHTLTANLRRGIESQSWLADENRKPWQESRYSVAPLHARISYKSTTKLNKLRDDAIKQHAKFFIVIDDENTAQLHNLDTKDSLGSFSPNPTADNYIATAIANLL